MHAMGRLGKSLHDDTHSLPQTVTKTTSSPLTPSIYKPIGSSILYLFPCRLAKPTKKDKDKELLKTFRKVEVNIPLLDAIQQVCRYAKFLKELCANKRKLKGNKVMHVGKNCSTLLQKKLPLKLNDPRSFTIPIRLGDTKFTHVMLDLGASINVMPYSIHAALNLGSLKETDVVIQFTDRSNAYLRGVLEDVLV